MATIEIDGIVAKPSEKVFGFLDVGTTSVNTYRIPVAILNGANEGKTLCLLGGTHGTEYASIEAVIRTIQNVDPNKMRGAILAVPVVNGPQFEHRSLRLSPIDQENQNRVFPGDPDGNLSLRTAHILFSKIVSKADVLCDCHGGSQHGDLDGFVFLIQGEDEELNLKAIEMAKCFPCKHIFARKGTDIYGRRLDRGTPFAQDMFSIPCIMPEAGTHPVRERQVKFHYDGIQNLLKYLGILDGKPEMYELILNPERYRPKAKQGGIWLTKVEIGQKVEAGQELGNVTDLFGNVLETFVAPEKGFVRFVCLYYSVNCGEPLIDITLC